VKNNKHKHKANKTRKAKGKANNNKNTKNTTRYDTEYHADGDEEDGNVRSPGSTAAARPPGCPQEKPLSLCGPVTSDPIEHST
jgi:hypothetical protein